MIGVRELDLYSEGRSFFETATRLGAGAMQTKKRRRLLVDYRVQGALIGRVLLYWVLCLVSIQVIRAILSGVFLILNTPLDETSNLWLSELLASLLFVPLVVCDVLRVTNRFVGPLYRLRREMHRLAQGESVAPVYFRNGDMGDEFAETFNALRTHVEQLASRRQEPPATAEHIAPSPVEVGAA